MIQDFQGIPRIFKEFPGFSRIFKEFKEFPGNSREFKEIQGNLVTLHFFVFFVCFLTFPNIFQYFLGLSLHL